MNKIKIDYQKLCKELTKQGKSKKQLSLDLGRHDTFIAHMKDHPEIPVQTEKLICLLLGLEPGSLVEQEREPVPEATILVNIYQEILEERKLLEQVADQMEAVYNKLNTNTLQLARIKECVSQFGKSDYDKAVDFLRDALSDGKILGDEILLKSDAAGIKRADIMKAKRELNVDSAVTGYGKSQKTWWFIPK